MSATESKRTVLLVDDDIDFLEQMKIRLKQNGFTVLTAECEIDAKAVLEETRPDLAIIDLMMDEVDSGFTLAHHIKKLDKKIPVIMVTGVTSETGLMFDASAGQSWIKADALLAKPVRFEQLQGEIERLLGGNE
ncbi:MAG: response regulator [bacterium]|nr:response regulator [bacterium]